MQGGYNNSCISPVPMIQEGINEIESPRKPYRESPGRRVNGVEVPHLDTGDDLDGLKSPSPRAAIRTDAEVSPLQLTKKDKSKQRQEKLQEEKDNAANEAPADPQPSDQSNKEEGMLFELIHLIFIKLLHIQLSDKCNSFSYFF